MPILLGVGLVLILFVGGGAFVFWKFYWQPRSQPTETATPATSTEMPAASAQQASDSAGQAGSTDSGAGTAIESDRPVEVASSEWNQEPTPTGLENQSPSGEGTPVSSAGRTISRPKPVSANQQTASPVIATQDNPLSSAPSSFPADSGQQDRPVSPVANDDSPTVSPADDSANATRPVDPPSPSEPIRSQPPRYEGPDRGTLVWSGDVVKGDQVVIENESANRGTVRGALPGVPCTITLNSPNVAVFEAPGPRNRYRRVGLRFNQNGRVSVVLTWEVIR